jgi:hypothetical protein
MPLTFQPVIPWPLLIAGGAVALAVVGALAWQANAPVPKHRLWMVALRIVGVFIVLGLLANPGYWQTEGQVEAAGWGLMLDRSASMATTDGAPAKSRFSAAKAIADSLRQASRHPEKIRARSFAVSLEAPLSDAKSVSALAADGFGSQLGKSGLTFLEEAAETGARWSGVVVLSDGRQTASAADVQTFTARARALGIPIHTMAFGGPILRKDLVLRLHRHQIVTFPNQTATVPVQVENQGLGLVQPELRLLDAKNVEVSRLKIAVKPGETANAEFSLAEGSPAGDYRVEMPLLSEDERPGNNSDRFHLRVLESRTRVFVAEGAPYWDTKFLAQLLREQGMMEVDAVYRLQPERFYRVVSGKTGQLEETTDIFPDTAAALNRYDLIVLGKGADAFLTPARLEILRAFVRDQGGALLFSRGKPSAGPLEGLEPLEPGRWGEETGAPHTFLPTPDGEESGLFGERLPAAKSDVWRSLPALTDVRSLVELRPFTRVLAAGERTGGGGKVPILVARRYGRGMVAAVNGDGLWRWSFSSGKKAGEDWHRDFWLQLLQWASTYSEFLPGEDFSMRLSASSVNLGESVRARIGYRGQVPASAAPVIELVHADQSIERITAAPAGTGEDGHPRWGVVLVPAKAGVATVRLVASGKSGPTAPLSIVPPPLEDDERSADAAVLEALARNSGGKTWTPDHWQDLLKTLEPDAAKTPLSEARWEPYWNQAWVLLLALALFMTEWITRRRLGMV